MVCEVRLMNRCVTAWSRYWDGPPVSHSHHRPRESGLERVSIVVSFPVTASFFGSSDLSLSSVHILPPLLPGVGKVKMEK